MKRGQRNLLIVVGCALLAVITWVVAWPGEREPSYQGRKLSYWLEVGYFSQQGSPERSEASHALQEIGTNALPYLLTAIQYQHSSSRERAIKAADRVSVVVPRFLRSRWDSLAAGGGERCAETAEFGFKVLGPAASPAVPELMSLLKHTNADVCARVMDALVLAGVKVRIEATNAVALEVLTNKVDQ